MRIPSARRLHLGVPGVLATCGLVAATLVTAQPATAETADGLTIGGIGDVAALSRATGQVVPKHVYGHLQGDVPVAAMITVNASGLTWLEVANASPQSKIYGDIVRWAQAVKARQGSVQLAFDHAPESTSKRSLGTPEDYKAAYRKIVGIFDGQGVKNARWVFRATSWGFKVDNSAANFAPNFYPGDAYIDIIGGDAYNRYGCGSKVNEPLSTLASGLLEFAKAHGKPASVTTFAANSSPERQAWLVQSYQWLNANSSTFKSAFYLNSGSAKIGVANCSTALDTKAELDTFGTMLTDSPRPPTPPTPPTPPGSGSGTGLTLGAVGDIDGFSRAAGSPVAVHAYGHFQGNIPTGEMITVNANGLPWSQVANARAGSGLGDDIVRWAKAIKSRRGTIEVAFGHEPEAQAKRAWGTPEQYQAAYRNVVNVFRGQGVTNVKWVFQATDWGFRTTPSAVNYAPKYYPGDAYIDIIGADAYNWNVCGPGGGGDESLATVAAGAVQFARSRGKLVSLPEFAAHSAVNRAAWLTAGYAWMKANRSVFASAYYFNRPATGSRESNCAFTLNRQSEFDAVRAIANDSWSIP